MQPMTMMKAIMATMKTITPASCTSIFAFSSSPPPPSSTAAAAAAEAVCGKVGSPLTTVFRCLVATLSPLNLSSKEHHLTIYSRQQSFMNRSNERREKITRKERGAKMVRVSLNPGYVLNWD